MPDFVLAIMHNFVEFGSNDDRDFIRSAGFELLEMVDLLNSSSACCFAWQRFLARVLPRETQYSLV